MPFTTGHALLIGVNAYPNATWMNVNQTKADAEAVAGVLRDEQYCGYPDAQVALLTDSSATRQGILDALDRLAGTVGESETVLLFYAGHGMDGEDGAYHLATCDVRLVGEPGKRKVAAGAGISQSELLNKLRAIKAGRMLMIFNACHSGNISPATLADEAPPETGKSLPADTTAALLATGSGRIIITACRPQQYSFVGTSAQTIFGQTLVDTLHGQNVGGQRGYIGAYDLYGALYDGVGARVQQLVDAATRQRYGGTQEPELTVIKGVGPFAVALYRGAAALGEPPAATEQPRPDTAVHAVTEEESRRAFEQIINVGQGVAVGRDVSDSTVVGRDQTSVGRDSFAGATFGGGYAGGNQTNIAGDQINAAHSQGFINRASGPITQNLGPQSTVNTGGGAYISGNTVGQGNIVTGGTFGGPVIGGISGGTVTFGGGAPAASGAGITLDEALARVQQAIDQARQQGNANLASDLEDEVATPLRRAGDPARRQEKLAQAQQSLDSIARSQPALQELAQAVRQVR